MKRVFTVAALGLALLLAVVTVRAARVRSRQPVVEPAAPLAASEDAAGRLSGAIRFQTISRQPPAEPPREELLALHRYLVESFPAVHAALEREVVADYSLLYTWKGTDGAAKPVLLLAHLDVVPVESGTEARWAHPPFEGRIADGFVWGRGTMDDKASALGILEGVEALLKSGFAPRRTLLLAFGHDEEIGGQKGAGAVAALLKSRSVEVELVLDEGSGLTQGLARGIDAPVALVAGAEKGSASLELVTESEGGHAAMPPRVTAVGILSRALVRLEEHPLPASLEGPPRQMLEALAPEMSFAKRAAFANLWLFGPVVTKLMAREPSMSPFVRTTTAPTMLEGSPKENVLPTHARAVVNFRIRPGETSESVLDAVKRIVDDPRVRVEKRGGAASEPSRVSDPASPGFGQIARSIRQVVPGALVAPALCIAGTDSRQYAALTRETWRFVPVRVGPGDLARFHGLDERIAVANYLEVVRFYAQLIRNTCGP